MKPSPAFVCGAVPYLLMWVALSPLGFAQSHCGEGPSLNAGRPTVSNATTTTACGSLEMDHGWTRQILSSQAKSDSLNATLRVGLTRRIDVQWSFDELTAVSDNAGTHRGFGDNAFALRYRLVEQSRRWPSIGLRYGVKLPTASTAVGGSGFADHQVSLLLSRDIRKMHLDFNSIETFYGSRSGFVRSNVAALAATAPVTSRFAWLLEAYGGSQADGSCFASHYFGTLISVNPHFVFDAGMDIGLTSSAPNRRLLFGFSYSLGQLRSISRTAALRPHK